MRPIKFRGKRSDNGKWVFGYYLFRLGKPTATQQICSENSYASYIVNQSGWYEVIPETVGQFTGLTDKHGKEIYEGDLINIGADSFGFITNDKQKIVKYEIQFEGCEYILYRDDIKSYWGRLSRIYDLNWVCQIIGTIHDKS